MDRGAWWAAIHGVAKSRTRLSDLCVCEVVLVAKSYRWTRLTPPSVESVSHVVGQTMQLPYPSRWVSSVTLILRTWDYDTLHSKGGSADVTLQLEKYLPFLFVCVCVCVNSLIK